MLKAIQSLNNHKAPGVDYGVTAEAIKYGCNTLRSQLVSLCK